MGASSSKKSEITITSIRSSTEDIRSTLRREKKIDQNNKEELHRILIDNSKKLDTLRSNKSKKKQIEIDQIQKMVSDVSEELLEYNDANLDRSITDESHSFIHVDPKKIKTTKPPSKQIKITSKNKDILKNLDDIDEKLNRLKNEVNTALKNDDISFLKLQKKKIEMLSTDLEMLLIPEMSEMNEIKLNLEKDLYRYYQKILKKERKQIKKDVTEKGNDENSEMTRKKLKSLEIMMEDIQDILQNFSRGDTRGNLTAIGEELNNIENQLSNLDDNERENMKTRTKLLKKVQEIRKKLEKIKCEEESNGIEEIIMKIDEYTENSQEENMEKLKNLERKLVEFPLRFQENIDYREEYLDELKKKFDKIDPNHDGVVLRPKLKKNTSYGNLLKIQEQFTSLEKEIRATKFEEARKIDDLLERFENSIRKKRQSLAGILQKTDFIKTNVKVIELPSLQTIKTEKTTKNETTQKINYGNVEKLLENLTKISDRVDEISAKIDEFDGMSEDLEYNFLIASLLDKKFSLENHNHRTSWNQIDIFKHEILEKIERSEGKLRRKLLQNVVEKNLKSLRDKIKRFSGNFQNIQYRKIEQELKELDKRNEELKNENIQKEVEQLQKILIEKSQIPSMVSATENQTDTLKIITETNEIIQKLYVRLQTPNSVNIDEKSNIERILHTKTIELSNLNVKNDTPLFYDVQNLLKTIESCRNSLKSKENSMNIRNIENKLFELEREISNFDGTITDEKYLKLDEKLNNVEKMLNQSDFEHSSMDEEKLKLSLRINYAKTRLDQIASDGEKIQNFEKRAWEILENDRLIMEKSDKIDEELIDMKISLEKMNVTETLSYRKITLLNYIEYLLKKINAKNDVQISRSVIV